MAFQHSVELLLFDIPHTDGLVVRSGEEDFLAETDLVDGVRVSLEPEDYLEGLQAPKDAGIVVPARQDKVEMLVEAYAGDAIRVAF